MSDLISRSAVLKKMDELIDFAYRNEDDDLHHTLVTVCSYIDEIPALDVAPVIYCKDCSHARPLNLRELMVFDSNCFVCTSQYGAGTSYPEYEMTEKVVFPKSFCCYAHRRKNGW